MGFVEIETPILTRSTPEGSRDFLVPSRLWPGTFYALPQSPQQLKQLLMVGGQDRYYQIVRCLRDEAARADRGFEFTQLDVEMSFVTEEDLIALIEPLYARIVRETVGVEVATPFPRLTYAEMMDRYGSDKPDLRYGMELVDLAPVFAATGFNAFAKVLADGGVIKALAAPDAGSFSRKELDRLIEDAKGRGAAGLVWMAVGADGFDPLARGEVPHARRDRLGRSSAPAQPRATSSASSPTVRIGPTWRSTASVATWPHGSS